MYDQMRINNDATTWTLGQPVDPAELTRAKEPLAFSVTGPLSGTVLLSVSAAASVALLPADGPLSPMGWIPGGQGAPLPLLYLPSPGANTDSPNVTELPETTDVAALISQIKAAMAAGTRVEVPLGSAGTGGVVVLNGAALPFVAVFPPHRP
jgi:hypothetical protein